jgi:hypothetical protein
MEPSERHPAQQFLDATRGSVERIDAMVAKMHRKARLAQIGLAISLLVLVVALSS